MRGQVWTPRRRAAVIGALAIAGGSLFLTTYTLALGDPVPHRIDAALVGDPAAHMRTIDAVERMVDGALSFQPYRSLAAARLAMDRQQIYATLDVTSAPPTLSCPPLSCPGRADPARARQSFLIHQPRRPPGRRVTPTPDKGDRC